LIGVLISVLASVLGLIGPARAEQPTPMPAPPSEKCDINGCDGWEWMGEVSTDALLEMYYSQKLRGRQLNSRFRGVTVQQIPNDLWSLQEIIWEVKPEVVIETGTFRGGSALFFAYLLDSIHEDGSVITIDVKPRTKKAAKHEVFKRRVHVVKGDSVGTATIKQVASLTRGRKALVTLDSLHSAEHVAKELDLYAQFVSVGSYMIVQDTFYTGLVETIDRFLETHPNFELDPSRERYLFTKFAHGYLKRVR
jgi:cephalosporin hydroxylase